MWPVYVGLSGRAALVALRAQLWLAAALRQWCAGSVGTMKKAARSVIGRPQIVFEQ
jgi:hypothetical protein